jgi:hypothetical protein
MSICTIDVAGKPLTLYVEPPPEVVIGNAFEFKSCEVTYAGDTLRCSQSFWTLTGGSFVHIPELALSPNQMDTLRLTYFLTNLPEQSLIGGAIVISVLSMVLAIVLVGTRWWPRFRWAFAVPAVLVGAFGSYFSLMMLVLFLLTVGVVD